jgi:hypothetical protein
MNKQIIMKYINRIVFMDFTEVNYKMCLLLDGVGKIS